MATTAQQVAELQKQNNEMYIQSAREQMAFQERMSNSAHQREIADYIKAGLNPVLSATGGQGATTPNGAQADVDTSSMVNYLLNEMNNENARKINNAQVAAQRYAAEMSYKAAQVAANAQIKVAEIGQLSSIPGWIGLAVSDPSSPQGQVVGQFMSLLGIDWNSFVNSLGNSSSNPSGAPSNAYTDTSGGIVIGPKGLKINTNTGKVDLTPVFGKYFSSDVFQNKLLQGLYKTFPKTRAHDFIKMVNQLNLWNYKQLRSSLMAYYRHMNFSIPKAYQ